jgi:hypothetical protein
MTTKISFIFLHLFYVDPFDLPKEDALAFNEIIKIHLTSAVFILFAIFRSEFLVKADYLAVGIIFMLTYFTAIILLLGSIVIFYKFTKSVQHQPTIFFGVIWSGLAFAYAIYSFGVVSHDVSQAQRHLNLYPDWLEVISRFVRYKIF